MVDYKWLIAGKYYFHILIDNYSRWPVVAMVMSTNFQQLQGRLEDSFSIHGIPESITHNNRPCYNSTDWATFSRKWGFETRHCMPENPKANGIAERFMGVLVKIVHAAIAGCQDPKLEVKWIMFNYRKMPHPSTGKTLAELMMRWQIRTRLLKLMRPIDEMVDREAKALDGRMREERKTRYDKKNQV